MALDAKLFGVLERIYGKSKRGHYKSFIEFFVRLVIIDRAFFST